MTTLIGDEFAPARGGMSRYCEPFIVCAESAEAATGAVPAMLSRSARPSQTAAFKAGMSMSRLSPSERRQAERSGGQKRRQLRRIPREIGDSIRHRSGVRKMSRISSPATASSRHARLGAAAQRAAETAVTAQTSQSPMEWASEKGRACSAETAQTRASLSSLAQPRNMTYKRLVPGIQGISPHQLEIRVMLPDFRW